MEPLRKLPTHDEIRAAGARLVVLRAAPGSARLRAIRDWLDTASSEDSGGSLLRCDFAIGGPWAGVRDVVRNLWTDNPQTGSRRLLQRHARELSMVLPSRFRDREIPDLTLMDVAPPSERVRGHAMDRAYRLVQGLVEWTAEAAKVFDPTSWVFACDGFENAGSLATAFFQELLRRRGTDLDLTLLVTAAPGGEVPAFSHDFETLIVEPPPAPLLPDPDPTPDEGARRALKLEQATAGDVLAQREALPDILWLWSRNGRRDRILFWSAIGFTHCYYHAFYEDALRYGDAIRDHIDEVLALAPHLTRWNLVGALAYSDLAVRRPERALDFVLREGMARIDNPANQARICYVLAMIYARHLPPPDHEKAEACIHQGLAALDQADLSEEDRAFLRVFILNGLAFIRHRQGRAEEALELCRSGYALLEERLPPDRHRLHRSSLLYNMAQVHAALGSYETAVEYYTRAAGFDPNNTDFHHDRGNALAGLDRLEEAVADYQTAIRLSPPYHEVWTNLGQALKRLGRFEEARDAYTRALDLAPSQPLPRLGRAQSNAILGHLAEARADYTAALASAPDQPLLLANRAVLWFQENRLAEALADLDDAIRLTPDTADLYFNRAAVYEKLGRMDAMKEDLRAYLERSPGAEDREEVEARLAGSG
jgi:tetratricopeptide (TPR) repeat protein